MAKKGNLNLEFCILKTLMNKSTDPETKSILLSSLTQNSFAFDESKDVYDLIFKEFTDASKPIPSLSVILNHPEISERSKIFLKKEKYQPFDDKEDRDARFLWPASPFRQRLQSAWEALR